MKKLLSALMLMLCLASISQVIPNKDFVVQVTQGGSDVQGLASAIDFSTGAVYTCGYKNTVSAGKDLVLAKLDSNGVQLWSVIYNFASLDDKAFALCVDASGNVYVTGSSEQGSGNADIVTIKYNSSGTQQWVSRVNGTNNTNDVGKSILFDGTNVWVTGYATITGKGKDAILLKLNGSTGATISSPKRNGTANGDDIGEKICTDGTSIFVAGTTKNTTTNGDIFVACFNISASTLTWSISINGSASGDESALDCKFDNNELYICGYSNETSTGNDYYFARINKSNGTVNYSKIYDGGYSGSDMATSLVPDKIGDYGITGIVTNGSNTEYHTQMYSTSALIWTHIQPVNGAYTTSNPKIALDTIAKCFYVCGAYYNSTLDGLLYQIDPTGIKRWTQYHNGSGSARDINVNLVVDGFGRIFLNSANETSTSTGVYNYDVIRYSQTPVYMPVNYSMLADTFSMAHLFYPNNGQIVDSTWSAVPEVLYYSRFSAQTEFIMQNKVAFCEFKSDSIDAVVRNDSTSRVDMIFSGANEFSEIFPIDFQDDARLSYFLSFAPTTTNVAGASHLIVPNIYPLIDLHYSSNSNGAKYYFVVKPSGDPNNIRVRFDGALSTATVSNKLVVTSEFSSWEFKKPDVYNVSVNLMTMALTTTTVTGAGNSRWVSLGSDTYSVDPGTYDPTWPLVIEFDMGKSASVDIAGIDWSTYIGGTDYDNNSDIVTDANNNIYMAGYTHSTMFPNITSAQPINNYYGDGIILKFNSAGVLKWSTWVGGTDHDEFTSLDVHPITNELYCVGQTDGASSGNITQISKGGGAYNSGPTGVGFDGFIFQLDGAFGTTASWCAFFGSSSYMAHHGFTKCKFDGNNELGIIGYGAGGGISVTGGTSYSDVNSQYDGLYIKLNSSYNIGFSTYLSSTTNGSACGSTKNTNDYSLDIDFNSSNDAYIVGASGGNNFPNVSTAGSTNYTKKNVNCDYDGTITRISSGGSTLWSTYFGSNGNDYINSVKVNGSDVYFAGYTDDASSFTDFSSSNFYFNSTKKTSGANNAGFFICYNNSNVRTHATLIGGNGSDALGDIVLDNLNNVYLGGWSTSTNLPQRTVGGNPAGIYGLNPVSSRDYFVMTLIPGTTNLAWTTQFGGNADDGLNSGYLSTYRPAYCAISPNQKLFFSGTAKSSASFPWDDGIAVLGGTPWFQNTLKGNGDLSITRFDLNIVQFVGIKENGNIGNSVFVYPNPTNRSINVKIDDFTEKYNYKIYNNLGQLILSGNLDNNISSINVQSLTTGMYLLEIMSKDKKATAKFIKND